MRRTLATMVLTVAWASVGAAQVPAGGEFRVNSYTTDRQMFPRVSMDAGGAFVIVWSSLLQDGSGDGVFGQRYAADGSASGAEFQVPAVGTGNQGFPVVTAGPRGSFLAAWSGSPFPEDVYARLFEASGAPVGAEFVVNTNTGGREYRLATASLPNGFVVAWDSNLAWDGNPQNLGGRAGLGARLIDRQGVAVGPELVVSDEHDPAHPAVATAPGGFVVVWMTFSPKTIWGRRYDTAGNALGPTFEVSTDTGPYTPLWPTVAMAANGSFVVVWHRFVSLGSGDEILGRLFAPSGAPIGGEFLINSITTGDQAFTSVAADELGNFVVTWTNYQVNARDVFGRRLDASGVPRGGDFRVNVYTTNRQIIPEVDTDDVGNFVVTWNDRGQDGSNYGAFAQRFGGLVPAAAVVDTVALPSTDGNRVLEPGEVVVDLRPSWRNVNGAAQTFGGVLTGLTGPAGATYTITAGAADYGTVAHGDIATCTSCYAIGVSAPPVRPAVHWDATAVESITPDAHGQRKGWRLHVGESFTDVPRASLYYRFVETLLHNGVTAGCSGSSYCPQSSSLREQMPVFVLVAREGPGYAPRACTTPPFDDVPPGSPFCPWIAELVRRDVVSGCGGGNYCPSSPVSREEMAVFIVRTLDPDLTPPDCTTPIFADVPADSPFCPWIEELARRQVVGGCGGGNYCPAQPVSREEMGVFISVAFGLQLYGP